MARGIFFLIVDHSGAGKGSLIQGAEAALADDDTYEFARHQKAKAFTLVWRVYDTDYGIVASYNDDLNADRATLWPMSHAVWWGSPLGISGRPVSFR